jgi:hypothetical protein
LLLVRGLPVVEHGRVTTVDEQQAAEAARRASQTLANRT